MEIYEKKLINFIDQNILERKHKLSANFTEFKSFGFKILFIYFDTLNYGVKQ